MNQTEQMREALQAIETVLADAYHRHFAECCGRGQGECCGDFIEQWTPEDHKILDTLSPIQRKLSQALATEPAPAPEVVSCGMGQMCLDCNVDICPDEMLAVLKKIATVNAMDYEYQQWARQVLAKAREL